MRKLFFKVALLVIPTLLFLYFLPILYYQNKGINKAILSKFSALYPLVKNKRCIVIAGDSRAERQLIPDLIEQKTGVKTVNIAVSSGDLISFLPYLHYFNPDSTTIVFSASSWQTNDGGITPGYFSLDTYIQLNFFQRLSIFKFNLKDYIEMEDQLLRNTFKDIFRDLSNNKKRYTYDPNVIHNKGFLAVNKYLPNQQILTKQSKNHTHKKNVHPWYQELDANGYRNQLFQKALATLGNSNFKVILYQPPVTKSFYISNKSNSIGAFESNYGFKLELVSKRYKNIHFINFYDHPLYFLNDSCFYDPQHLNYIGAKKFTDFITNQLLDVSTFNK